MKLVWATPCGPGCPLQSFCEAGAKRISATILGASKIKLSFYKELLDNSISIINYCGYCWCSSPAMVEREHIVFIDFYRICSSDSPPKMSPKGSLTQDRNAKKIKVIPRMIKRNFLKSLAGLFKSLIFLIKKSNIHEPKKRRYAKGKYFSITTCF